MNRLHVVVLAGSGPQSFATDWAAAVEPFHEVTLVRTRTPGKSPSQEPFPTSIPAYTVTVPRLRPTRAFSALRRRLWLSRFLEIKGLIEIERGPIDLLHGHFYTASPRLLGLDRSIHVPYVLTEHSTRLTGSSANHKPLSSRGLRIARQGYANASQVLFVSNYLRACAEGLGLTGTFDVIGNPVATDVFTPDPSSPTEGRRIVWVGRLESDKDPALLLQAVARLRRTDPDVTVEVIGDGPDRPRLRELARSLGIDAAVRFHGRLTRMQIADRFRTCSVFVSTSRVETFGLAIAEAAAAGIPVVAPDLPPVRELFASFAQRYDVGDPNALAATVARTMAAPRNTAPQVAEIRDRFSPVAVGQRIAAAYSRAFEGQTSVEGVGATP